MDLSRIKYAMFDFDDTLCIHTNHWSDEDKSRRWHADVLLSSDVLPNSDNLYETCSSNRQMKAFMDLLSKEGTILGLVSAVAFVELADLKVDWVVKHYGYKLLNHCVGNIDAKVDMLIALADAFGYERSEILLVDDHPHACELAAKAGFVVMTPMQVVNFVDKEGL